MSSSSPAVQQPQQSLHSGRAAALGVGAGAAAASPAALAGLGPVEAQQVVLAGVLAAFLQVLSALRQQHRGWLGKVLIAGAMGRDDVAETLAREMEFEQRFAEASLARVSAKMPSALAILEPGERRRAVAQVIADEERFAAQRAEAMAARAYAAVDRARVRRESPLGAFWQLGVAQTHTEGCRFMAGRFWPWAVLDRVHPPRHHGCSSRLKGYAEAVGEGLMAAGAVPDTGQAIRDARGVVMEGRDADALLLELQVREMLLLERGVPIEVLESIELKGVWDGSAEGVSVAEPAVGGVAAGGA